MEDSDYRSLISLTFTGLEKKLTGEVKEVMKGYRERSSLT